MLCVLLESVMLYMIIGSIGRWYFNTTIDVEIFDT